ncbi:threonine synthase [Corynebacterium diphtheriae]|nr:threonine synthase [Corynebacterium diphtheriae]
MPERFASIMDAQRRVTDLPNDVAVVKDFIVTSIEETEKTQ